MPINTFAHLYREAFSNYSSRRTGSGFKHFRRGECPVCSGARKDCRQSLATELIHCRDLTANPTGYRHVGEDAQGFGMWSKGDQPNTSDWQAKRDQARQERELASAIARSRLLSVDERDRQFRPIARYAGQPLTRHRTNLLKRGLTSEQIQRANEQGLLFSWPEREKVHGTTLYLPGIDGKGLTRNFKGLAIAVPDQHGRLLGIQIRSDDPTSDSKYFWVSSESVGGNGPHLPNGEMPLGFYPSKTSPQNGDRNGCEGFLKPFIGAQIHGVDSIGAAGGNFASSPEQLRAYLEGCNRFILCPDGGAVANPKVMASYRRAIELVKSWGYPVLVRWWGQVTKQDGDVDEITSDTFHSAELITWEQFEAIAAEHLPKQLTPKERYKLETREIQREINALTYKPDLALNCRYLPKLDLSKPGTLLALNSVCGTGKTELMKHWISLHKHLYPGSKRFLIGDRNILLHQTCERTDEVGGFVHIQDLDVGHGLSSTAINNASDLALCFDSLLKLEIEKIPPYSAVFLDEGDAGLLHILEGGTLGDRQPEILQKLEALIRHLRSTNGFLFLLEDGLTDLPINLLTQLGNWKLKLVTNQYLPEPRKVRIGAGSPSGFIKAIIDRLLAGERVFVPTTSQESGEKLEWIVRSELGDAIKIIRLDSLTAEEAWAKDLMKRPDDYLATEQPHLFILSPTGGRGVSITKPGLFDRVMFYAANLETRAQHQMLWRYRVKVPWDIYCSPFLAVSNEDAHRLRPDMVMKDWERNTRQTAMLTQTEQHLTSELEANPHDLATQQRLERFKNKSQSQEFWNCQMSFFRARVNGSQARMLESLTELLKERGHDVAEESWPNSQQYQELLRRAKQAIQDKRARDRANADPGNMLPDQARLILNSSSSKYQDRLKAQNCLLQERLPGIKLDVDFLLEAVVKDRGALLRASELLWLVQHSEIATIIDRKNFCHQLGKPFIIYKRLTHNRAKVDLFNASGILKLVGVEYRETDESVISVKEWAIKNAIAIHRVLGLTINPEQTGIHIANRLLKKLGYETASRREGGRGQQVRIYQVTNEDDPHRAAIMSALERKWAKALEELSPPVATISNNTDQDQEMVTTATSPPNPSPKTLTVGDEAIWGQWRQRWLIEAVEGAIARLKRVGGWDWDVATVPLAELEAAIA